MGELELKLRLQPRQRDALLKALGQRRLERVALVARYFDTADLLLARHGMALRLRQEDGRWVQGLKVNVPGALERLEDERAVADADPLVQHALHAASESGRRLLALLRHHGEPPLAEVWRTDVTRTLRRLHAHGADLEWALDEGRVEAAGQSRPICELELEFKGGDPAGLFAAAHDWQARHGLWLDVVSKAERGALLHQGLAFAPPVKAAAPGWRARDARAAGGPALLRTMVASCLQQILPNAGELADGSPDPVHAHQLRVGLRRLRAVARAMRPFAQGLPPHWEDDLRPAFDALGRAHDVQVFATSLAPRLQRAGAPAFEAGPMDGDGADIAALVRGAAFQRAALGLLAFAHGPAPAGPPAPAREGVRRLRRTLDRLWRRVLRDVEGFAALPLDRQHDVRKRLKRLRYLAEFAAPWHDDRAVKAWMKRVKPAQDALGDHVDQVQAALRLEHAATQQPAAWFAVGWLRAQADRTSGDGTRALRRLAKATPFWAG
jgi:triphosphatase